MSFPQPRSSISVLEGQEFFRLHTELQSNGDIYEIDTSVKGMVIGPNSDIQNVRIYYYDLQAPNQIGTALISVNDPFVTRMNALMANDYPGLGAKARVLVTSDDIIPHVGQTFIVSATEPNNTYDLQVWHRPWIDLMSYHRDPPATPATRAENQWQETVVIVGRAPASTGVSWYFFPHYRRKYFHARFFSNVLTDTYTYNIYGVTLFPFRNFGAIGGGNEFPSVSMNLLTTGTVPARVGTVAGKVSAVLYSDRVPDISVPVAHPIGYYDYICVSLGGEEIGFTGDDTSLGFEVISTDWA